jgi:hypothetical protein
MDNGLEKVQDHMSNVNMNTLAAAEHIGQIKRKIRVMKECSWEIISNLPYKELPQQMVIHLLHFFVIWLNNYPITNSISKTWSLSEIILHHCLNYTHHCRAPFRTYCKRHENKTLTNDMTTCGTLALTICLGPKSNFQGMYNCFSLVTGQVIKHHKFDKLLVPNAVITHLAVLSQSSGVPRDLVFANQHCIPFDWLDKAFEPLSNNNIALCPDIPTKIPGVLINCTMPAIPAEMPGVLTDCTTPTPPTAKTCPADLDWTQCGDEAILNADVDDVDIVHPPSEDVIVDNEDDTPLPPVIKQTFSPLPKVESEPITHPSILSPSLSGCYPSQDCAALTHLGDYHMFMMIAEDTYTNYPYCDASGCDIYLAILDDSMIAHVCHYVMVHTADSMFISNPNNKKQYGLKASLSKFSACGHQAITKNTHSTSYP